MSCFLSLAQPCSLSAAMNPKVKLLDIARALGISTGTVHRALHNHNGVSPVTKARVQQMAKTLGYRPNLAARYLSSKRNLRISVNTLQGTTSFWDDVRAGISEEARALMMENVEIQYRTYPRLGEGEEEAFEAALNAHVDGIISFPSRPQSLESWMSRASQGGTPVVCVATDAPDTGRLAVVSVDNLASGSLAADLMGNLLRGAGSVALTCSSLAINEHAEKYHAFEGTLRSLYPQIRIEDPIEDHDVESEAYEKCRELFTKCPDLAGVYVTTEASLPVLQAARELQMLDRLTVITTDLFPALVEEIRSRAVAATIYQRPRTQGRMALRVLHEYLVEGECSSSQVSLAPHLVMRGNLDFFLQRQTLESQAQANRKRASSPTALAEYFG
jgi:LacI family transcriptional regulator